MELSTLAIGIGIGAVIGAIAIEIVARLRLSRVEDRYTATAELLATERIEKATLEERTKRIPELEAELSDSRVTVQTLREEVSLFHQMQTKLETELAERERSFQEQLDNLEKAKSELSKAFAELSQGALQQNNKLFLSLAEENLKKMHQQAQGDLDKKQEAIDNLVKPIRESLEKVDNQIKSIGEKNAITSSTITEQLKSLGESERRLQGETQNLVRALRNPNQRGRWGEIQLKRVVEMAGMVQYCDFVEQETTQGENGALRPDMKILLPGGKTIIVDSKVPLEAYLSAIEEQDEATKAGYFKAHARQVREQIKQLGSKRYWDQFDSTPDCVIMFLPGEPMYGAALEQDPELIEFGVQNKVLIATPVTLIGLLRFVSHGWRQEKLEENAQKISDLGKDLYSRVTKLADHFAKLGTHLDRAVTSFNESVGTLEGRVLPQARKFKELQASTAEDIETVEMIERQTRPVVTARRKALSSDASSLFELN
jgi:DNA recombination protein RmuC